MSPTSLNDDDSEVDTFCLHTFAYVLYKDVGLGR